MAKKKITYGKPFKVEDLSWDIPEGNIPAQMPDNFIVPMISSPKGEAPSETFDIDTSKGKEHELITSIGNLVNNMISKGEREPNDGRVAPLEKMPSKPITSIPVPEPKLEPYQQSDRAKQLAEQAEADATKQADILKFFKDYQDVINKNRITQAGTRAFDDAITIGELINNLNHEISDGVKMTGEAPIIESPEIDTSVQNRNITMRANATIQQLRDSGLSHLIPAVVAQANNASAEYNANAANQQAQMDFQTAATNAQARQAREQFMTQVEMQNEASRLNQIAMQGQAVSANMQALRDNNRLKAAADTGNDDNQMRLDLNELINKYPDLAENLAFLMPSRRQTNS